MTVTSRQERLGEAVQVFDGSAGGRRTWAWVVPLAAVSLAFVPLAIAHLRDRELWAGIPALLLSMASAGTAGWLAGHVRLRGRGRVVRLHTGGIAVSGPGGETEYVWDELVSVTVSGVRTDPDAPTRWRFTVVADDGSVLRFTDEIPDVRTLGEAVAREVASRIVPRRLAEVKAGESVRMGPFTVDLDGVEKDGERLAWSAVDDVVIDNGLVTVRACDGRADLVAMASQTPDAAAFAVLCRQVGDLADPS
ncbi:MAG TPA: DUF6585 family protein [Spirillospora sp.]